MSEPQPDPRVAVLRAAGHEEAARLLDALAGLETPAPAKAADPQPEPAAQDPRQAEAEVLLAQLRRDVPNSWATPGDAA